MITAMMNILWLYLAARMDADVPLRLMGNGYHARACCERALAGMLDEAGHVGMLDLLRCPCVRGPDEVLALLTRVYGGDGAAS